MRSGGLTERLIISRPVKKDSGFGKGNKIQYERVGEIHAERVNLSGRVIIESSEKFHDYSACYYIRFYNQIEEGWMVEDVRDNGRKYIVASIDPIRSKQMKVLKCERYNE